MANVKLFIARHSPKYVSAKTHVYEKQARWSENGRGGFRDAGVFSRNQSASQSEHMRTEGRIISRKVYG